MGGRVIERERERERVGCEMAREGEGRIARSLELVLVHVVCVTLEYLWSNHSYRHSLLYFPSTDTSDHLTNPRLMTLRTLLLNFRAVWPKLAIILYTLPRIIS